MRLNPEESLEWLEKVPLHPEPEPRFTERLLALAEADCKRMNEASFDMISTPDGLWRIGATGGWELVPDEDHP